MIQRKKIAILGATSHIAKGLIYRFGHDGEYELRLFARSPECANEFLNAVGLGSRFKVKPFEEFGKESYGTIINCVGISDPGKLKNAASSIFRTTETFNTLVLNHLEHDPEALYVNFSSGAVYGTGFASPADEKSQATFSINPIDPAAYYGIAKLHSEARHRAMKDLHIVDLRVYGYFSRFIDLNAKFMMSEVVSCILHGREFVTGPDDIVRDYIHPDDLASLVRLCIDKADLNDAFDVPSLRPVKKFEILEKFSSLYGLRYAVRASHDALPATGKKTHYYPTNAKVCGIGFAPRFTSLDSVVMETKHILKSP